VTVCGLNKSPGPSTYEVRRLRGQPSRRVFNLGMNASDGRLTKPAIGSNT